MDHLAISVCLLVFAKRLAAGGLAVAGGYLALLLAFSFLGREETLRKGDRKYFCEIDCHLAYSLQEASQTKALGVPPHLVAAQGVFHVATVKTWFDEKTIASFRGERAADSESARGLRRGRVRQALRAFARRPEGRGRGSRPPTPECMRRAKMPGPIENVDQKTRSEGSLALFYSCN